MVKRFAKWPIYISQYRSCVSRGTRASEEKTLPKLFASICFMD